MKIKKSSLKSAKIVLLVGVLAIVAHVALAALEIRTTTFIFPPTPVPPGVSATAHAKVQYRARPGDREEIKIHTEDLEVIGHAADPAFCQGFYEVVIMREGREMPPPSFPGFIAVCVLPNDFQGATVGDLRFRTKLEGPPQMDLLGMTVQIWQVAVARDPVTGEILPGPSGEPFVILERVALALEGILN